MPGGIPYSPELATAICHAIASGESLRTICSWYGMPHRTSVMRWLADNDDFAAEYVKAHETQADHYADEMIDIADNGADDVVTDSDGIPLILNGKLLKTKTNVSVQHAKLRIDTRKWIASKLKPKKYGDKVQTDITSGGKPIKNEWHLHPVVTADNGEN